ncbi:MAG: VOC family protein [Candidatus Rokubacteria bacterium]|nr:VOC family protein [Candidatus Rokubacteria bacterium]
MLRGIDHIVIVVPDLETAAKSYERLGFTVVRGGRHPIGTHNALIALADGSYIELIAFYETNPEHRWWVPLERGGGLVDFCMQTDDLGADTLALRRAGVEIDDPKPLTRVRPDGYRLRWVLAIPRGDHRGVAPFLIQDETPREERVPRETTHRNGVTGIASLTVAVRDAGTVRPWYAQVLRQPGDPIQRDDLDGAGARFTIGPHAFDFVAPRSGGSPLGEWLRRRGSSPYAATLRTSGRTGRLDESLTQGALLSLT